MIGKVGSQVDKVEHKKAAAISRERHFHRPATRAAPVRLAGGNGGTAVACSASVEVEFSAIGICFGAASVAPILQERIKTQGESFQT